jgi:hypothetical protein
MPSKKNSSKKNNSKNTNYPTKVGIPKGLVDMNSIEYQKNIINKRIETTKDLSCFSVTHDYSFCL